MCANPAFEQMARHWFHSFGTNPSAELFVRSRAYFLISGGRLEEHLVHLLQLLEAYDRRQGVVLKCRPGGDEEVHHLWGQFAWACAFRR
jgi:hypothetical protein